MERKEERTKRSLECKKCGVVCFTRKNAFAPRDGQGTCKPCGGQHSIRVPKDLVRKKRGVIIS